MDPSFLAPNPKYFIRARLRLPRETVDESSNAEIRLKRNDPRNCRRPTEFNDVVCEFRVAFPANTGLGKAFRRRRVFTVFKRLHGAPHSSHYIRSRRQGWTNFPLGTPLHAFGRVHGKRRRSIRSAGRIAGGTYTLKSSVGRRLQKYYMVFSTPVSGPARVVKPFRTKRSPTREG